MESGNDRREKVMVVNTRNYARQLVEKMLGDLPEQDREAFAAGIATEAAAMREADPDIPADADDVDVMLLAGHDPVDVLLIGGVEPSDPDISP